VAGKPDVAFIHFNPVVNYEPTLSDTVIFLKNPKFETVKNIKLLLSTILRRMEGGEDWKYSRSQF